jgi:hypothetical protein
VSETRVLDPSLPGSDVETSSAGWPRPRICAQDGAQRANAGARSEPWPVEHTLRAQRAKRRRIPGEILDNTTTPAQSPSPAVVTRLFTYSTARLGFWRRIVVLPRFYGVRWRPDPPPSLPNTEPLTSKARARNRPPAPSRQSSRHSSATPRPPHPRARSARPLNLTGTARRNRQAHAGLASAHATMLCDSSTIVPSSSTSVGTL